MAKGDRKNIIKKSVALSYEDRDSAPKIIAKGKGKVAEKIVEKGKQSNIYIHEDEKLVNDLMAIELYNEIPEELYDAIAKLIFFVYSMDEKKGKKQKGR